MSGIHAESSRIIDAPAEAVYQILHDYRVKHPSILPPESFIDYGVEEGGDGAGTVFSVRVRAGGQTRPYRMRVSEPEPGRVIQERDFATALVTTFTITPTDGDARSTVTIASDWQSGNGIVGFLERTFAPIALRGIYVRELDRLAAAVQA